MNFKVGDKVVEISSGDIGVIAAIRSNNVSRWAHYVEWETGERSGETLWLHAAELKHLQETNAVDLSGEKIVIAGVTYILMRNADNV